MKTIHLILLLTLLHVTASAAPLKGEWRVEFSGASQSNGDYSSGQTTIVHHNGKVYESTWSSGVAGPTKILIGQADPKALKILRSQLSALKGVHHQIKGGESVQGFTLYHQGENQHFSWEKGSKRTPAELRKAVAAFKAAVASVRK